MGITELPRYLMDGAVSNIWLISEIVMLKQQIKVSATRNLAEDTILAFLINEAGDLRTL